MNENVDCYVMMIRARNMKEIFLRMGFPEDLRQLSIQKEDHDKLIEYAKKDLGITNNLDITGEGIINKIYGMKLNIYEGEEYVEKLDIYQHYACRTMNLKDPKMDLINGLIGLSSEAGECLDVLKKHLEQDHPFDKEKMAKELGDVLWYVATVARSIGYNLSFIASLNIYKLEQRYPDKKFDAEKSINRED